MTDSDYSKLTEFASTYLHDFQTEQTFYDILNNLPRINFVCCTDCIFHGDCIIEKSLPGIESQKFCSYGKTRFDIRY